MLSQGILQSNLSKKTIPAYAAGNYPDSYASRLREKKFKRSTKPSLPKIAGTVKERAGGGHLYPDATDKVLMALKAPKNCQAAVDKLLHNKKVYQYFLQGKGKHRKTSLNATRLRPSKVDVMRIKAASQRRSSQATMAA